MRWAKDGQARYSDGDKNFMERFQNRHQLSISPLLWTLCPQVVVRVVPVASRIAAMSSDMNSGAASVWITSGAPRRKKISSSSRGARVWASRLGRARTETVSVKLS